MKGWVGRPAVSDELLEGASEVRHMPFAEPGRQAYEAASTATLELADALIAVWDGQPAKDQGGPFRTSADGRQPPRAYGSECPPGRALRPRCRRLGEPGPRRAVQPGPCRAALTRRPGVQASRPAMTGHVRWPHWRIRARLFRQDDGVLEALARTPSIDGPASARKAVKDL